MYEVELNKMMEACRKARVKILEVYKRGFDVEIKDDNSPVTEADKGADEMIREILHKEFPDYGMLTEESFDDSKRLNKEYLFVVDPVDGTKDFVKKDDMFTTNIALVRNKEVVAGVVGIPVADTYYFAIKGQGAFKQVGEETPVRIHVNNKDNDLIMLTSVFHQTDAEMEIYKNNQDRIAKIEKYGSAIKACRIAEGLAEVSYRMGPGTKEWDTAASQIIVLEAGGVFAKPDLSPISYNREDVYNREGFVVLNKKENNLR